MTSEDDIRGFIFKRIIYHLQYKNVLELKIDGEDEGCNKILHPERIVLLGQKKVEVASTNIVCIKSKESRSS